MKKPLLDQIADFCGDRRLSAWELSLLCSRIALSIPHCTPIEIESYDGFIRKRKKLTARDRLDAGKALQAISALLVERLANLSDEELAELDRAQRLISGATQ